MNKLIDVGANLTHKSFGPDLAEVLKRAAQGGVNRMVVTGTCLEHSRSALSLATTHSGVLWCTAGVHPHEAAGFNETTEAGLRTLLDHPLVVAVGECGLDYYRDFAPRAVQREVFARQLAMAADRQRPLFLHQREAHDDFLGLLKEQGSRLPKGVAHCFTNGPEEMHQYLNLGLCIGITGWICDEQRGGDLRRAVVSLPLDRVVLETDAPYLLPTALRSSRGNRRNEPVHLGEVLRTLATCMGLDPELLAAATTRNAEALFGLSSAGLQPPTLTEPRPRLG